MQTIGNALSDWAAFMWSTLLVVPLVGVGTIFVLHSRGLQCRFFRHGVEILTGKFDKESDATGNITNFKALATAVSWRESPRNEIIYQPLSKSPVVASQRLGW